MTISIKLNVKCECLYALRSGLLTMKLATVERYIFNRYDYYYCSKKLIYALYLLPKYILYILLDKKQPGYILWCHMEKFAFDLSVNQNISKSLQARIYVHILHDKLIIDNFTKIEIIVDNVELKRKPFAAGKL